MTNLIKELKSLISLNDKPEYNQIGGGNMTPVGTITFKYSSEADGINAHRQYIIFRWNTGLYTFMDSYGRQTVISKGILKLNKHYQSIVYKIEIDNNEVVDADNITYQLN